MIEVEVDDRDFIGTGKDDGPLLRVYLRKKGLDTSKRFEAWKRPEDSSVTIFRGARLQKIKASIVWPTTIQMQEVA